MKNSSGRLSADPKWTSGAEPTSRRDEALYHPPQEPRPRPPASRGAAGGNPGEELADRERLGDKVVSAGLEPAKAGGFEHDDRQTLRARPAPQAPAQLDAGKPKQIQSKISRSGTVF